MNSNNNYKAPFNALHDLLDQIAAATPPQQRYKLRLLNRQLATRYRSKQALILTKLMNRSSDLRDYATSNAMHANELKELRHIQVHILDIILKYIDQDRSDNISYGIAKHLKENSNIHELIKTTEERTFYAWNSR
jgi:hypothetical protein